MKVLRLLALVAIVAGVVGLLSSTIAPAYLRSKASLVQRITPYDKDTAALTGEPGDLIGEPQLMVIDDQAAFLPGKSEKGVRLADDNYMKSHGVYPLQMKTVDFVAGMARLGFGAAFLLGSAAFLALRGIRSKQSQAPI